VDESNNPHGDLIPSTGDLVPRLEKLGAGEHESRHLSPAPAIGAAVRDPIIGILLLAGIFDWLSGNAIHSVLLFTAALALAWDAIVPHPIEGTGPAVPVPTRLGPIPVAGALAYSVIIGGFGRYSWTTTIAVIVPAGAALALAWRRRGHAGPGPKRLDPVGEVAWASVFVALALWELTQLLLQPSLTTDSYAHPTISVLTDPVLTTHPGRSIVLFLWLALGWFLLQR